MTQIKKLIEKVPRIVKQSKKLVKGKLEKVIENEIVKKQKLSKQFPKEIPKELSKPVKSVVESVPKQVSKLENKNVVEKKKLAEATSVEIKRALESANQKLELEEQGSVEKRKNFKTVIENSIEKAKQKID